MALRLCSWTGVACVLVLAGRGQSLVIPPATPPREKTSWKATTAKPAATRDEGRGERKEEYSSLATSRNGQWLVMSRRQPRTFNLLLVTPILRQDRLRWWLSVERQCAATRTTRTGQSSLDAKSVAYSLALRPDQCLGTSATATRWLSMTMNN